MQHPENPNVEAGRTVLHALQQIHDQATGLRTGTVAQLLLGGVTAGGALARLDAELGKFAQQARQAADEAAAFIGYGSTSDA